MRALFVVMVSVLSLGASSGLAEPSLANPFSDLRWRNIGPFRGGWSTSVEGIPEQPDAFYFGAAGGGVWKSDDAGRTWQPLFQNEGAASVGAIAIAPSNPKVIYVGTGQLETRYDNAAGNGVYRSDDGGKTWRNLGLADTRAIGRIAVDPKNADIVLVAAFGHLFGPNRDRGVYRSEDGGKNWTKTLFVDENTGAVDLATDPVDFSVVYATTWQARNYPWLSYFHPEKGPGSGIFKSTDGGKTWRRLSGAGWPKESLGRIGVAVAPHGRIYALVDARLEREGRARGEVAKTRGGLYRSDDAGSSWQRVSDEEWQQSDYFGRLTVDPIAPDRIYVTGRSVRRSDDGGKTFEIIKGAPGGDDYHFVWINPKHQDHLALASDQGTTVSVNGGNTWSSWYNQPTGQFYHLATDNRFPYWIYSGQQDSGSVAIASRSDYGALSYREWHPVGADERDDDVPDPSDPETVYGSGLGGDLARYDARTGQVAAISPHVESSYAKRPTEVKYRYTWITPMTVSPRAPNAIFMGSQVLFRSVDRGQTWSVISPDVSGSVAGTQGCEGEITLKNARPCGFGVIYSIALSPRSDDEIWVGTDDGRIQATRDGGKHWADVTPQGLAPWSKVSTLELSALETGTAYAAIDNHRLDDFTPHAYRTHDGGRTWTPIITGLPGAGFVVAVRADPVRRGLLYAGTNTGVFVSFDDGDHWQSLKSNLPTVIVGDLSVHGNDLIAATQGRAIWILDDLAPLRQLTPELAKADAHLFKPSDAYRLRKSENRDTPLPPETALGSNPPAGAVIDYTLAADSTGPVTLEILDAKGSLLRKFSSADPKQPVDAERYFQSGWLKQNTLPPSTRGHHRFVWDLHAGRPKAERYEYSIGGVWGDGTPVQPEGALAPPGVYSVRLVVGGKSLTQSLTLLPDPRVHATPEAIARQFDVANRAAALMERSYSALQEVEAFRKNQRGQKPAAALDQKAETFQHGEGSFARLNEKLAGVFQAVESADTAPTEAAVNALEAARKELDTLQAKWSALRPPEGKKP